ncbi:MAG: OmpA family protein [Acidobacteriota bacterium]
MDVVKPESFAILDKIAEIAKGKPDWKFEIEGHTDSVANDAYNQTLSQRRADSVRVYLIKAGVSRDRLTAAGFGETKPIADNATEIGRAQNRRVELVRK